MEGIFAQVELMYEDGEVFAWAMLPLSDPDVVDGLFRFNDQGRCDLELSWDWVDSRPKVFPLTKCTFTLLDAVEGNVLYQVKVRSFELESEGSEIFAFTSDSSELRTPYEMGSKVSLSPSFIFDDDGISVGVDWWEDCWDDDGPKRFKSTAEAWLSFINKWVPRAVGAAN